MNLKEPNDAYSNDFSQGLLTLASLCTFFGVISVLTGFSFVISSYMVLSLLTPISKENIFTFARGHLTLLHIPSVFLLINFYTSLLYIIFLLMNMTGGTWRSVFFVSTVFLLCLISIYPIFVYAYNVSIKSGALSSTPIISKTKAIELTPDEIQLILFQRARKNEGASENTMKFYMELGRRVRNDEETSDDIDGDRSVQTKNHKGNLLHAGKRAALVASM